MLKNIPVFCHKLLNEKLTQYADFNMKDVVMERDIEQDLLHWKLKKSHAIVFV